MAAKVALGVLCAVGGADAGSFVPFANVEELKPRRIEEFCTQGTLPDLSGKHGRVRRCEHHFKKQLEDDSELELGWSMDVDPDNLLSLDTEAEHGVRLTGCRPDELELELPESHARHAAAGKIVVGSRFTHRCEHRLDGHLYHRIKEIRSHEWLGLAAGQAQRRARIRVGTEELPNLAHAVPRLQFHFKWMPSEALNPVEYPDMKTDYGINREYLRKQRRLFSFPSLPDSLKDLDGVDEDAGGFKQGGTTDGNFDTQNGVLNLMPKQLSNFGWNWNFFMNTTQEPNFVMNAPGLKGKMKIRKPFVKIHAGIYLNFSSVFTGLTMPPKVDWTAGIKGHGQVQGRMLSSMNTTGDKGTDPFSAFRLPILKELQNPMWFEKVDFATGTLPLSMEPGFQFTAQMYHHGTFHGAVGVGGKTHGHMNPSLTYDSLKGFDATFDGELIDTNIWPPLWMIFTKQFEMGIIGKPSLLMRGDFAGLERATMVIETRPYMNVTIQREGSGLTSASDSMQKVVVYPSRVMGLDGASFSKKYKVKITLNGEDVETSSQVNWGQVEFRDHITNFELGTMPQKTLMDPSKTQIGITLIEVDDSGPTPTQKTIGTGSATCTSILKGVCQPSPANVAMMSTAGTSVATVQVFMLWMDNAAPWFATQIRGIGVSFPQVILRQETLAAAFPSTADLTPGANASTITMHLTHGGQTYVVGLSGTIGNDQTALAGDATLEFGPAFTESWSPCSTNIKNCESPMLKLYVGGTQIGTALLPLIEFSSQTAMQGTSTGGFMASSSNEMNVPSTIALTAPGNAGTTIALVTMNAKVVMTLSSSIFMQPRAEITVKKGGKEELMWTVSDCDRSKTYAFNLQAYRLTPVGAQSAQAYVNYRQVGASALTPVPNSKVQHAAKCESKATGSLSAAQAPCSFSYNFSLAGSGYANGDQIIVEVSWPSGGTIHQMYSPPMELSSIRRLASAPLPEAAAPRRLWSQAAWNKRINQHNKSCNAKDLHFNFGLGMLMRGKVESISVPAGFPMIGGLDEEPELTTGFRKIAALKPGTDAADAFGGKDGILCQAGLCQGALPGCSEGGPKKMTFPRLVFDFNRPFHFDNGTKKGRFNGLMKQAMAYAFSTLPEMVDVMITQLNHSGAPSGHRDTTTKAPSSWWSSEPSPTPAPSSVQWPTQSSAPSPSPSSSDDSDISDAFSKWWSGASSRRLSSGVGSSEELPDKLEAHQVRMEFTEGSKFIIDRPLVEMMLQNGYFKDLDEVEDDAIQERGPLEITNFYIDSGIPYETADHEDQATDAPSRAFGLAPLLAAAAAALAVAALAARVATRRVLDGDAYEAARLIQEEPPVE